MGTHGRRRKEQHAEAEVCGQGRGVLRWRACCAGRYSAVMDDSAAISTDLYDSMSSEESESSGLVEGREGGL